MELGPEGALVEPDFMCVQSWIQQCDHRTFIRFEHVTAPWLFNSVATAKKQLEKHMTAKNLSVRPSAALKRERCCGGNPRELLPHGPQLGAACTARVP